MHITARWCLLLLALLPGIVACRTAREAPDPNPRTAGEGRSATPPLSREDRLFLAKLSEAQAKATQQDAPELFFNLNQLLKSWQDAAILKQSSKNARLHDSLQEMLTRTVYLNFDTILDQLEHGPQPNRVIAAAALGFSRIPENPQFPQVHPRALPALLQALDSGDDAIVENALLGLRVLADPSTPLDRVLPLLTGHHNPDVRANAALCIATVVQPGKSDRVLPYVLPALKDEDPKVRNHAVNIVRALKDPGAVSALVPLLADRYELIRANTARTLGDLGDLSACPALIEQVDHPKQIVRFWCLEALKKLTGKDYGFNKKKWADWWNDYLREHRPGS